MLNPKERKECYFAGILAAAAAISHDYPAAVAVLRP